MRDTISHREAGALERWVEAARAAVERATGGALDRESIRYIANRVELRWKVRRDRCAPLAPLQAACARLGANAEISHDGGVLVATHGDRALRWYWSTWGPRLCLAGLVVCCAVVSTMAVWQVVGWGRPW